MLRAGIGIVRLITLFSLTRAAGADDLGARAEDNPMVKRQRRLRRIDGESWSSGCGFFGTG
jgi:hypothetical protein